MNEELKQALLQTTHWNDFNKIARDNNLSINDLDEELKTHYMKTWKDNPGDKFFNENGVHEDPLPKKKQHSS